MQRHLAALAACAVLTACGTTTASLPYTPSMDAALPGSPVIGEVTATDARGEQDPNWIGAVRGGFGNSLKVLRTEAPLAEEVARDFRAALTARGMLAPGAGPLTLAVTIVTFKSDQVVRREAEVELRLVVTDRAGRAVYQDTVRADVVSGSALALDTGVFGSTEDLRQVAISALNQAINQALDKPAFPAHRGA